MACCLLGAKPLPQAMLAYWQLNSWEQISVNFDSDFYKCISIKCMWICRLRKWWPLRPRGDVPPQPSITRYVIMCGIMSQECCCFSSHPCLCWWHGALMHWIVPGVSWASMLPIRPDCAKGDEAADITGMGLMQDRYNCGLRMRRECRERFPSTGFKGNRLLAIPACITARASRTNRNACRDR